MDIRRLEQTDLSAWADLLALTFERQTSDMQNLLAFLGDWYPLIAYGAWDGSRLAGQYSCLLRNVYLPQQNQVGQVGMSLNMAVHPDYRGQGLVKKMSAPVYAEIAALGGLGGVGFSNQEGVAVDRHSKGYGYQVVGQMISCWIWLKNQAEISPAHLTESFPADISSQKLPFLHLTDDYDHLCHRFTQHPFRRYQFAQTETGGVIFRSIGGRGISLLHFWGGEATLKAFGAALRRKGYYGMHVLVSPPLLPLLKTLGVLIRWPYSRQPFYLTAKPFAEESNFWLDFKQWYCLGGQII